MPNIFYFSDYSDSYFFKIRSLMFYTCNGLKLSISYHDTQQLIQKVKIEKQVKMSYKATVTCFFFGVSPLFS